MARKSGRPTSEQFTLFHLQPQHAGQTLSGVLKQVVPDSTWGQIQTWIRSRHVQVNGNLCLDAARRVTEKDVIKLWREPLAKPVTSDQLKLPYIDEHLLVVEKPAGITSVWHQQERRMPAHRRLLQPTLEELLPAALDRLIGPPRPRGDARSSARQPSSSKRGAPARWPIFPVHRLDRDTSGLMIFARTRVAEQKLVSLFRDHHIERGYWAVALGQVQSQTIRSTLVRDRGDGLRGSLPPGDQNASPSTTSTTSPVPAPGEMVDSLSQPTESRDAEADGQLAITHVELVERVGPYSIVRCRLETGRTHQIRIHLSELGHPLCGEKTYLTAINGTEHLDPSQAPRQALHSERLVFTHPITGERLRFQMALPADLKQWLTRLRQSVAKLRETQQTEESKDTEVPRDEE